MELLKQKIMEQGEILSDQVLSLDSILNHRVDPPLILALGKEFASRFEGEHITKVVTMESSGISLAFAVALELGVPFVFARRKKTLISDENAFCERVPSFTKGIVTDIMISRKFLSPEDKVLLIDDIIANGDTARGMIRIIGQAGAELAGLGVAVEKSFQAGAKTIRDLGVRVESLVKIASLENRQIRFDAQ